MVGQSGHLRLNHLCQEQASTWSCCVLPRTKAESRSKKQRPAERDDEEPEAAAVPAAPKVLAEMAPQEVDFFRTGEVPCGAALMEEETDEAIEAIAKRTQDTAKRAPTPPAPTPPQEGQSSSSSNLPWQPAPEPHHTEDDHIAQPSGGCPGGIPADEVEAVHRNMASVDGWRLPAEGAMPTPPGCSLRLYEHGHIACWEAKLPKGKRFGSPGRQPRASRRRLFGPDIRSKEKARLECGEWLRRAEEAGVLA